MILKSDNYYVAKIFATQCIADIRINDVPIIRQILDCDLTCELPVNYLIEKSGLQKFSVEVKPLPGQIKLEEVAKCEVEIWRYDDSGNELMPIESVCKSVLEAKDRVIPIDVLYDRKEFLAHVSYEISRWGDCIRLDNVRTIGRQIAYIFQRIGNELSAKNYDYYLDLVRNRDVNICKSLLLGEEEIEKRSESLIELLNDGFELVPMKGGKVLQYFADSRGVTVLDHDLKPALRFANEESGEMIGIELILGIKKGKTEFEVI